MLNKISAISLILLVSVVSSQSLNAQEQENNKEFTCKVTLKEESGEKRVLIVPISEVADYHDNPNLVGINCRNEAEGKRSAG